MQILVDDQPYSCSLRGHAWQRADDLLAVDGTIEIEIEIEVEAEARSPLGSAPSAVAIVHGRLERASPDRPFIVPVAPEQIGQIIAYAREERAGERRARLRIIEARWVMTECPIPHTSAPQYPGKAEDVLESRLALGSAEWMQDWPLEVSDSSRIAEFCAFYDEVSDPLVRFDVMQLALFSYDELPEKHTWSEWFRTRLRRDFALHGHTIAYWATLDREADDPELRRSDPESVFTISGLLREIWEASLSPVDVERA